MTGRYVDRNNNVITSYFCNNNTKIFLKEAYDYARNSPDPSNQCGAIIVNGTKILSYGRNEFHHSVEWNKEKIKDRDWKLFYIEHAERNSLYSLAKQGIKTEFLTMVCPWFACADCARAILHCGISRVIGHKQRMDMTPERWKKSVDAGLDLLEKGGVKLSFWDGEVGCEPIIVNGEIWYP